MNQIEGFLANYDPSKKGLQLTGIYTGTSYHDKSLTHTDVNIHVTGNRRNEEHHNKRTLSVRIEHGVDNMNPEYVSDICSIAPNPSVVLQDSSKKRQAEMYGKLSKLSSYCVYGKLDNPDLTFLASNKNGSVRLIEDSREKFYETKVKRKFLPGIFGDTKVIKPKKEYIEYLGRLQSTLGIKDSWQLFGKGVEVDLPTLYGFFAKNNGSSKIAVCNIEPIDIRNHPENDWNLDCKNSSDSKELLNIFTRKGVLYPRLFIESTGFYPDTQRQHEVLEKFEEIYLRNGGKAVATSA
ncbi:MAG: hypothetical protein V1678_01795 [Candidatus Aenigmatarchaeota archaeon]